MIELSSIPGAVNTALRQVINYFHDYNNYQATKSLVDSTKLARVEPLCVISRDIINQEYMPDIMQSLLSMFAGYYLQAVSMLTQVNDIQVVRILDRLNPDRDSTGWLLTDTVSRESFKSYSHQFSLPTRFSLEAGRAPHDTEIIDNKTLPTIGEMSNLSVGKIINVKINFNKSTLIDDGADILKGKLRTADSEYLKNREETTTVTIPISIRLLANAISNETALLLLASKREDTSLVERYHLWRADRISFIKDLIFCQDLIDERKRALHGDESGTMAEIIRRVNNSKKFGLLTKNPSLVSASNIFVMSEEVAKSLEMKLGGKLSSMKVRDKAFDSTYAMLLVVVDREWERVTIYTRGINASTTLSVKELKNASKGKGPDISEILKSYNLGTAPTF